MSTGNLAQQECTNPTTHRAVQRSTSQRQPTETRAKNPPIKSPDQEPQDDSGLSTEAKHSNRALILVDTSSARARCQHMDETERNALLVGYVCGLGCGRGSPGFLRLRWCSLFLLECAFLTFLFLFPLPSPAFILVRLKYCWLPLLQSTWAQSTSSQEQA